MVERIPCFRRYARDFTDEMDLVFHGPYARNSRDYQIACTYAAYPLIIQPKLLRFRFQRYPNTPRLYQTGHPITITIKYGLGLNGHALYAMVREVNESLDTLAWPLITGYITVEVHTIPGFYVNWDEALPWFLPPPGVVFIQPHGFLEKGYTPLALYVTPNRDILIYCIHVEALQFPRPSETDLIIPPHRQLPPASSYPRHAFGCALPNPYIPRFPSPDQQDLAFHFMLAGFHSKSEKDDDDVLSLEVEKGSIHTVTARAPSPHLPRAPPPSPRTAFKMARVPDMA
jgi:hypothetical protein